MASFEGLILGGPAAGRHLSHEGRYWQVEVPSRPLPVVWDFPAEPNRPIRSMVVTYRHTRLAVNGRHLGFWVPVTVPDSADGSEARWILQELISGYRPVIASPPGNATSPLPSKGKDDAAAAATTEQPGPRAPDRALG